MLGGIQLLELFKQSSAMWLLFIASIFGVTFILERMWFYMRWKKDKPRIIQWLDNMQRVIQQEGTKNLLEECKTMKHPAVLVVQTAVENIRLASDDLNKLINTRISRIQKRLEANIGILGTLSSIAPLLGLFGTITGIIRSFRDIAITGSGGSTVVAMGVAVALVSTAVGIIVAIPALIAYNYFVGKATDETTWLENIRDEIIVWLHDSKG